MSDFEDWHRLNRRRQIAIHEGLCTCCAFTRRAGDPGPRPVRAVAVWTCQNGNREHLCETCLGFWRDNAAEDPELEPMTVISL